MAEKRDFIVGNQGEPDLNITNPEVSKYPIRCYIDCDYRTTDRPADVKRSFGYAKAALD